MSLVAQKLDHSINTVDLHSQSWFVLIGDRRWMTSTEWRVCVLGGGRSLLLRPPPTPGLPVDMHLSFACMMNHAEGLSREVVFKTFAELC